MKQQLWIVNSSLLIIWLVILILGMLLQQEVPFYRIKKTYLEESLRKKIILPSNIEDVYKFDLFGTYAKKLSQPTDTESLISPIPQERQPSIPIPPEPPIPEFAQPLNITLKGIALASQEEKSIAMITDETQKERIYHVGDKIKDGLLIKLTKNRATFLRSNGQHDIHSLRKLDLLEKQPDEWDNIIQKMNPDRYQIDVAKFPKKIDSLGLFTQMLSLLTAYKDGEAIGIKIGATNPKGLTPQLGLQQNDIIVSINDILVADKKNRINAYDQIIKAQKGDTIRLSLNRNNQEVNIDYELTTIHKIKKRQFIPPKEEGFAPQNEATPFKLSKLQQREERLKNFARRHNPEQDNVIHDIRQRLLDNMKTQNKRGRVR